MQIQKPFLAKQASNDDQNAYDKSLKREMCDNPEYFWNLKK